MRRGRERFHPHSEDREQHGFRTSQAYSSQRHSFQDHAEQPVSAARPGPSLSQSVDHTLKELRTMSAVNRERGGFQGGAEFRNSADQLRTTSVVNRERGDFQGVADFRNSAGQQNRGGHHGWDPYSRGQGSESRQPPTGSQPPSQPFGSPPFPPHGPLSSFSPSLPPPGPSPFRGPPPNHPSGLEVRLGHPSGSEVRSGRPPGSGENFRRPPPGFPQQGVRFAPQLQNSPRVSVPSNSAIPPVGPGIAAAPNIPTSHHPHPAQHVNVRIPPGPPHKAEGSPAHPVYLRGAAPPPSHTPFPPSDGVRATHPAYLPTATPSHSQFRPPLPGQQSFGGNDLKLSMPGGGVCTGQSDVAASACLKDAGEGEGGSVATARQQEVNHWLKKTGKWAPGTGAVITDKSRTGGKANGTLLLGTKSQEERVTSISEAQQRLHSVLQALASMQGEAQQLEELQGTADTPTWKASVAKLKQLKEAYLETKGKLDLKQMTGLKRKLDLRRKKRQRQKRRRQEDREWEQQVQFERTQKHVVIDQWCQQLQQDYLNRQQMKKLKETADKTLGKVCREIREASRMLDTVTRLQKLRDIRSDTAHKRGQTFPPSVAAHFAEKTEDLLQLITSQLQAFQKEEDALKLILETENEEAKEKEREEKRQKEREDRRKNIEEERLSLFGAQELPSREDPLQPFVQYYQQAQFSLQALQNVRWEWDSFVVKEGTPLSSRVPDGWVSPEQPSSHAWASVLMHSKPS
ncbi:hypothetical protein ACOMHN_034603 [Nucella lapillus]